MPTSTGVMMTLSRRATYTPKNSSAATTTTLQRSTSFFVGHVTRFISDFTSRKNWKRFFFGFSSFLEDFARNWFAGRKVREDSILLVIDEAQLVFNSRAWQHGQRMDWIQFFSQHRHFGYKVVLIAQFDRMIDRQIRSLIEIETNHRKLGNFGMKGLILSLPFRGRLFLGVSYYYGLKEKVGTCWLLPRRAYFKVYDSYTRFEKVAGT